MLRWSKSEQARYIAGFVDGEGWPAFYIDKTEKGRHKPGYINSRAVFISNTNKALLLAIQEMLKNLGIESRLYLDAKAGTRKSTKDSWKLTILGKENLEQFSKKIGFCDKEKSKTLQKMLSSYPKTRKRIRPAAMKVLRESLGNRARC